MFKDIPLEILSEHRGPIEADKSRCLRMRFGRDPCTKCTEICPRGAVSLGGGPIVDDDACTECMLCVSECPTGAFSIRGFGFLRTSEELLKTEAPVLGCFKKPGIKAHQSTPCLGFLSEEHLIWLMAAHGGKLTLNFTQCADCKNSLVTEEIRRKLKAVAPLFPQSGKDGTAEILLATEVSEIDYKDEVFGRRGFFNALRDMTIKSATDVVSSIAPVEKQFLAFSKKVLPLKRHLLNKALLLADEGLRQRLIEQRYFGMSVDNNCSYCSGCDGVCPSGAVKTTRDDPEKKRPFFKSTLCSGCGLCVEICITRSITMHKGFKGEDPGEFAPVPEDYEEAPGEAPEQPLPLDGETPL